MTHTHRVTPQHVCSNLPVELMNVLFVSHHVFPSDGSLALCDGRFLVPTKAPRCVLVCVQEPVFSSSESSSADYVKLPELCFLVMSQ